MRAGSDFRDTVLAGGKVQAFSLKHSVPQRPLFSNGCWARLLHLSPGSHQEPALEGIFFLEVNTLRQNPRVLARHP